MGTHRFKGKKATGHRHQRERAVQPNPLLEAGAGAGFQALGDERGASALGYKNVSKALTDHVEEDDVTKRYLIVDSLGRRLFSSVAPSALFPLCAGSRGFLDKPSGRAELHPCLWSVTPSGFNLSSRLLAAVTNRAKNAILSVSLFPFTPRPRGRLRGTYRGGRRDSFHPCASTCSP